jgi:superfamily I DNA and/or RNA helicase
LLARSNKPAGEILAIVCPHRRQNNLVKQALAKAVEALPERHRQRVLSDIDAVVCDTVERIQGQERECILVSLTGSDPDHLSGQWAFSHCPRRFNVAITRPRTKLIVAGSPNFFHFTPPDSDGVDLVAIAALKRWYLDRMDRDEIVKVEE